MSKKVVKKKQTIGKQLSNKEIEVQQKTERPVLKLLIKLGFLSLIILGILFYSDSKGYFNPDNLNNHTKKKWDAFYKFTKKNNVDILLLGNSHLYTGINPKNLSITLGANAFLLASPGTGVSDVYFGLKEALKSCKPSLVVVETYSINNTEPHTLFASGLSDQLKSFSARKNIPLKLASTPMLFKTDNYFYAWSNTIRNHDYIFTNKEQLERNKILQGKRNRKKKKKLYLGRYVRFTTGIHDTTLVKYMNGAPVDGKEYVYSKSAKHYVNRIIELCDKEGIELLFLTLPMYHKHVSNYPTWRNTLSEIIDTTKCNWLDLQISAYNKDFPPYSFENTFAVNQHMTYQGSLVASYILADYIRNKLSVDLPDRRSKRKWINQFYGEEGYFENYSPVSIDTKNKILGQNIKLRNVIVKEIITVRNKKNIVLIAKVDKKQLKNLGSRNCRLSLVVRYKQNNVERKVLLELEKDNFHKPADFVIYSKYLNPIEIIGVDDGMLECSIRTN